MPFDPILADRIREHLRGRKRITEKKMFGGLAFFLRGNILVGVMQQSLIARIGPDRYEDALDEPGVREFDITGKPMKNWVVVDPEAIVEDESLGDWIDRAFDFVEELPPKK